MVQGEALTAKQETFANLYALGTRTAIECAIDAGYSPLTARVKSSQWLHKVSVRKQIAKRKQELAEAGDKVNMTPELIMKRTAEIAQQNDSLPAAVSALRLGADVLGMTQGQQAGALPEGLGNFLSAVAESMNSARSELPEARTVEARELTAEPVDQQAEQPTE